ncbi:serine hydrolase [Limibacter armeniacum]|uniref:serine hydrolase domain-containing protein n=1 Tax=Limibacter armeniacum TaxID=466084 RepID=UPI002FE5E610
MKIKRSLLVTAGAALGYYGWKKLIEPSLPIITGYAAKSLCSQLFVTKLPIEKILQEDLGFFPVNLVEMDVNMEKKMVTASIMGKHTRTAIYREGLGTMLHHTVLSERLPEMPSQPLGELSLNGDAQPIETQNYELRLALNNAFRKRSKLHPAKTRAVVVVHKGKVIAEQYADGITPATRLLGWSMTKSIISALAGILNKQGKLNLDDRVPLNAWKHTHKDAITWRNMLQMTSGLDWLENYTSPSRVNRMLFENENMARFALRQPLKYTPGSYWRYSSGDTNILSYLLAQYFDSLEDYWRFPYEELFNKLGLDSMFLETDAGGHFVGSSYAYATARDWAKFGQLYLNKGKWEGAEILTEDWVDFTREPAPGSGGNYGAHFWLNRGGAMPDLPEDAYFCDGYQGQRIFIIPSEDLVIVRLGVTYRKNGFDFNKWVRSIIDAVNVKKVDEVSVS